MSSEPHQRHLLILEDERGRRELLLDRPLYSIGRDPQCDICLVSQFVSRRHATLIQIVDEKDTPYYRIVDGSPDGKLSANGLLVNGRKLRAHNLQNEDEIEFGPQVRLIYYTLRQNPTPPDWDESEDDDFLTGTPRLPHPSNPSPIDGEAEV